MTDILLALIQELIFLPFVHNTYRLYSSTFSTLLPDCLSTFTYGLIALIKDPPKKFNKASFYPLSLKTSKIHYFIRSDI